MNSLTRYFNDTEVTMRSVDTADVSSLVRLINEAYSYQDSVKGKPRTDPEHLVKRIGATDFYVVTQHDEIVGCVYLEAKTDSLHFGLLTLIPRLRKTGLGEKLLKAIVAYASENSFDYVELDYMSLAPWLKKYYQHHDFQETGDVTPWGSIDLIRMRLEVRPK